jgi:DNA-binding LacI/PurR family transcriptional regulator/DNA-binding transcriptional regulator YhcF (GntR family)
MNAFRPLSTVVQLASHLRGEILRGTLGQTMPGVNRLAATLGVSPKTVMAAVKQLEREGMLQGQGPRRRSRTVVPENFAPPALRVSILPYEETDRTLNYTLDLQYRLMEEGHVAGFASRTLLDLEMDAKRVARLVSKTSADAWVVLGGSREVLEWFAAQPVPAFALFGRRRNVPIAGTGPDKQPALVRAVDRLVELGHRRIVMLVREEHRKPQPGPVERRFLDAMELHGLPTNAYNLPDWDDSAEGFRRCLDSLFHVTPPTALIIDQASLFAVAQQHLARRGILAPEHVSLVSCDPDPAFGWFHPSVAHIRWEPQQAVRRILHWADHVTRGKDDRRQTLTKAEFIEGGTIGPARSSVEPQSG